MEDPVIVAATRTAVGKFQGVTSNVTAVTLGIAVVKELIKRANLKPEDIDEVILGQVLTAGCGQNPARQTSMLSSLPMSVPAMTINKVCGSGLKAVVLAAEAIKCLDADIIIAGGQENMELSPHLLKGSRKGKRMGDWQLEDSMINPNIS